MTNPNEPAPDPGIIPELQETVIFIDGPSDPLTGKPSPLSLKLFEADRENIERFIEYGKQLQEKVDARRLAQRKDGKQNQP